MYLSQPQSPFLKHIPENQHAFLTKKLSSLIQIDKENIVKENPQILVNKMEIGQNQIDSYLIDVESMVRLKKQTTKEIIRGLQKQNKNKKLIIGISGHTQPQLTEHKVKSRLAEKSTQALRSPLLNLNILLKVKPQEYPYIPMFSCVCLLSILKLYLSKSHDFKQDDLKVKWKYDILLKEQKIGQIMILYQQKVDQVFVNIGIRLKLSNFSKYEQSFCKDFLEQFCNRLNISKNLRQSATKIHQEYQDSLAYLGEQVFIKRRQPNQWQETVSGRFLCVNQIGHAILQNEKGNEGQIQQGYMQRRGNSDSFKEGEKVEQQKHEQIQI